MVKLVEDIEILLNSRERDDTMATLEAVLAQAFELKTVDKLRLIEKVTPKIEEEIRDTQVKPKRAYPSLWGVCRGLGVSPSAKSIDQARQEMWKDFPREDIG